jgi:hypothetical protein
MCLVKIYNSSSLSKLSSYSNLVHFHAHSKQWVIWCSEIKCQRVALEGSLVEIYGESKTTIYVLPLCRGHANSPNLINIGTVVPIPKFI